MVIYIITLEYDILWYVSEFKAKMTEIMIMASY